MDVRVALEHEGALLRLTLSAPADAPSRLRRCARHRFRARPRRRAHQAHPLPRRRRRLRAWRRRRARRAACALPPPHRSRHPDGRRRARRLPRLGARAAPPSATSSSPRVTRASAPARCPRSSCRSSSARATPRISSSAATRCRPPRPIAAGLVLATAPGNPRREAGRCVARRARAQQDRRLASPRQPRRARDLPSPLAITRRRV